MATHSAEAAASPTPWCVCATAGGRRCGAGEPDALPDLFTLFYRLILRPLRERACERCSRLAVALGVAVVLAIELAGDAAAGRSDRRWKPRGRRRLRGDGRGWRPAGSAHAARAAAVPFKLDPRIEDYA